MQFNHFRGQPFLVNHFRGRLFPTTGAGFAFQQTLASCWKLYSANSSSYSILLFLTCASYSAPAYLFASQANNKRACWESNQPDVLMKQWNVLEKLNWNLCQSSNELLAPNSSFRYYSPVPVNSSWHNRNHNNNYNNHLLSSAGRRRNHLFSSDDSSWLWKLAIMMALINHLFLSSNVGVNCRKTSRQIITDLLPRDILKLN